MRIFANNIGLFICLSYICAPSKGLDVKVFLGGVAERLNAPVLKTGIRRRIGGSNPSSSAKKRVTLGRSFSFSTIQSLFY